jgi:hypothetical protein
LARGKLFLPADSDDASLPTALEKFAHHWLTIPENERIHLAGVCGLCQEQHGKIVGDSFPGHWSMDSDSMKMRHKFVVRGEKWDFSQTNILRAQPFPEHLPGYVPEGVVWTAIAVGYKTRFINKVVRIYFQDAGNQVTQERNAARDTVGSLYWKTIVLNSELKWF